MTENTTTPASKKRSTKTSASETWKSIVRRALRDLGGTAFLGAIYDRIDGDACAKTRGRKHWRAKVRQVLETSDEFVRAGRGVWSLAEKHSAKAVKRFERQRRKLYPRRAI